MSLNSKLDNDDIRFYKFIAFLGIIFFGVTFFI